MTNDLSNPLYVVKVEGELFNEYLRKGVKRDCAMELAAQRVRALKAEAQREANARKAALKF